MTVLKLGTRRSLLAWAQSGWLAREIEKANPGTTVKLVGIETRGDLIQDTPLSQVEGKEFFVAEIDEALLGGAVDLTVHSMKDLSLDRPAGIRMAAAPTRENPRDVVLFAPRALEKIRKGRAIKIGTSAPRRLENIPGFLSRALPRSSPRQLPLLEFVEIRGNVNTRIRRLHELETNVRALDAVVLAFAGLIRLWNDVEGREELEGLLGDESGRVRWMVLPLSACPAAPAQGMLAVECRADDAVTFAAVNRIHDERSFHHVRAERELLREWGGGCHQKFGATQLAHERLGELLYVRGRLPDDSFVEELRWKKPERPSGVVRFWDGSAKRDEKTEVAPATGLAPIPESGALFVAHSRATNAVKIGAGVRIWTSGEKSWFNLASRGYWVEGCAEGLGFDVLKSTLAEPVLRLPKISEWTVLTHEDAIAGWEQGRVIGTYRVTPKSGKSDELKTATHVFWSSGSQFDALAKHVPAGAHHACGPGKTAARIDAAGFKPTVFPSAEEWRQWIPKT